MRDFQAEHERVLERMKRQLDNMSAAEIDKQRSRQKIVDTELRNVQRVVMQAAHSALPHDPRQAYKAVRYTKYRKIFGGSVSILTSRRGPVYIDTSVSGRSHRRSYSRRSEQMDSYWGSSRSFILRWLDQGTRGRTAGTRGGKGGSGNRGALTARRFFKASADMAMMQAKDRIMDKTKLIIQKLMEKQV